MFHIEKAHYIVDEMVANGVIVENNKANILRPLALMDIIVDKWGSQISAARHQIIWIYLNLILQTHRIRSSV